jgi:hypothetical protein
VIRKLAEDLLSLAAPDALVHAQRLAKEWMPAVIDGHHFEMIGIMLMARSGQCPGMLFDWVVAGMEESAG